MYEVGSPGEWVTGQKWKRRASGALNAAGAVLLGVLAVACLIAVPFAGGGALRALAAVAGAGFAAGCWYLTTRARASLVHAGQAAVGIRSEREVRSAIRGTNSVVAAAYGLKLGDRAGDCDVVVFTRDGGAVAIEVKTGHGVVTLENGTMLVGRRRLQKSPTRQAGDQARRLSRMLGRKTVLAVVCVPGMSNRPFSTDTGVWVCAKGDLREVLRRAPRVFGSAAEAEQTMKRLWHANPA
jgi:nuclease-like protein